MKYAFSATKERCLSAIALIALRAVRSQMVTVWVLRSSIQILSSLAVCETVSVLSAALCLFAGRSVSEVDLERLQCAARSLASS
jgi:hypothetical protein